MNDTYNATAYLTRTMLNNIEQQIESVTDDVIDYIFDSEFIDSHNIHVGDNLNGKTLHLSFPRNYYTYITDTTENDIIVTDNGNKICYKYDNTNGRHCIYIKYGNIIYYLYDKVDGYLNPTINRIKFKLPNDFGITTSITSSRFYLVIEIYDNEDIIPQYNETWHMNNTILNMEQIDHLEQGIKNIGDYYYKPYGWQTTKTWLNENGTNMKNISYQDLNRWINNLSLINFDNLDTLNIWNTNILHLIWDTPYEEEWEDL